VRLSKKILRRSDESLRVVLELPKTKVTAVADEASKGAAFVAMIHTKRSDNGYQPEADLTGFRLSVEVDHPSQELFFYTSFSKASLKLLKSDCFRVVPLPRPCRDLSKVDWLPLVSFSPKICLALHAHRSWSRSSSRPYTELYNRKKHSAFCATTLLWNYTNPAFSTFRRTGVFPGPTWTGVVIDRHSEEIIQEGGIMGYAVEVIADASEVFCGNGLRFGTYAEAETYAKDLYSRWTAVRSWRVVRYVPRGWLTEKVVLEKEAA
jgi:hypothetical protein